MLRLNEGGNGGGGTIVIGRGRNDSILFSVLDRTIIGFMKTGGGGGGGTILELLLL